MAAVGTMQNPLRRIDDLNRHHAAQLDFIVKLASVEKRLQERVSRGDASAEEELEALRKRRKGCEFDVLETEVLIQNIMADAQ